MKITGFLGASGRTGSIFTRKALEEGHTVTAYVRNPDKAVALLGGASEPHYCSRRPERFRAACHDFFRAGCDG